MNDIGLYVLVISMFLLGVQFGWMLRGEGCGEKRKRGE
jgi:hypothetical protein